MHFIKRSIVLIFVILAVVGCSNKSRTNPLVSNETEERIKKTSLKVLERIKDKNYYGVKLMHYHGDINLAIYTPESLRFTGKINKLAVYLDRFGIDSNKIELIDQNQRRLNEKYNFKVNYVVFDNDTAKLTINIFFMNDIGPDEISFFNYDYSPKNLGQLHLELDSETLSLFDSLELHAKQVR